MNSKLPKLDNQKGQGLVESLIALGILLILFHALASLIIAAYDLLGNARTRTTARHIASSKMEEIRNMPYEDIGIVGGIPPGQIQQTQNSFLNGLDYLTENSVVFIDDPFDLTAPSDPDPSDYKRIRVEVSWQGRFTAGESIVLVTDITGEEPGGGGTLIVLVYNSNADPVSQADVHIVNTQVTPQIDVTLQTDSEGQASIPGAPPCNTCYEISVSKAGYSSDRTYSLAEVPNPNKPHATVIEEQLTQVGFTIDITSTLNISSTLDRSNDFSPLGNKIFNLTGNKTIGTDNAGLPIYKYIESLQTNSAGDLQLSDMESDIYTLSLDPGVWDLAGSNPLIPIPVLPSSSLNVLFASAAHQDNTLLLSVIDASGSAIASASAHLTGPESYDETFFTGELEDPDYGQAFFSPLNPNTYTATVTKTGYEPTTETIDVFEQTQYSIYLNPL